MRTLLGGGRAYIPVSYRQSLPKTGYISVALATYVFALYIFFCAIKALLRKKHIYLLPLNIRERDYLRQ